MNRDDAGSWLSGPPTDQEYPGQHMGRPDRGPGSVARVGRRVAVFALDWYLCWGLMALIGMAGTAIVDQAGLLVLVWAYQILCIALTGHTVGHLLFGMQVQTLSGRPAGWKRALVRSTLVMLVVPVVIADADQRGIHDRAAGTIIVKIR